MVTKNPFVEYQFPIVVAAAEVYRAEKAGQEPHPQLGRVALVQSLGDMSPRALHEARVAEAEVNVGARAIGHLAALQDEVESGGLRSVLARFERGATLLAERRYLRGAQVPELVDRIRGV